MVVRIDRNYGDTCAHSRDWASAGLADIGKLDQHDEINGSEVDDFHRVILRGDIRTAEQICVDAHSWPRLVLGTISRLDKAWQEDLLLVSDIAEAYWTLRRVVEALRSKRATETRLQVGRVALFVPETERHTFGPQLLSDQLVRYGWQVELWTEIAKDTALSRLNVSHYDVVGISVGRDEALDGLAYFIDAIRLKSANPSLSIVVGGGAIHGDPDQYEFLGADHCAAPHQNAIKVFEQSWIQNQGKCAHYDG